MYKYIVGIDIAKDINYATILDSSQQIIVPPFSFYNNAVGFEKLLNITNDYNNILFVMESTGRYHCNLFHYLHAFDKDVAIAHAVSVSDFRKLIRESNKNDLLDSIVIAKYAITMNIKPTLFNSSDLQELRDITRLRRSYIEQIASTKNLIKSLLDIVFPEYTKHFSNVFGNSALALLSEYPTANLLSKAKRTKVARVLKDNSHGRFGLEQADSLIKSAKNSAASRSGDTYDEMMTSLLSNLASTLKLVEDLDERIEVIMKSLDTYLESIPGVGFTLAAEILAEIGDVNRFPSSNHIISYAGLNSKSKQSGYTDTSNKQRITKKENSHLRAALFLAAEKAARFDPELNQYYNKKKSEGKHHRGIITGIARKLTNRIYTILTEHRPYIVHDVEIDSNWLYLLSFHTIKTLDLHRV